MPAFLPNTDPSIHRATHSSIYLKKKMVLKIFFKKNPICKFVFIFKFIKIYIREKCQDAS
jgi:hypothetical protein